MKPTSVDEAFDACLKAIADIIERLAGQKNNLEDIEAVADQFLLDVQISTVKAIHELIATIRTEAVS